jgi:hypothetical protein
MEDIILTSKVSFVNVFMLAMSDEMEKPPFEGAFHYHHFHRKAMTMKLGVGRILF